MDSSVQRIDSVRRIGRIALRLTGAWVFFVVVGLVALLGWVAVEERGRSDRHFADTVRVNAEFIRTGAPMTAQTARSLSEVLQMEVRFELRGEAGGEGGERGATVRVREVGGGRQRDEMLVRDGYWLVVERDCPAGWRFGDWRLGWPVGVFLVLSMSLGVIVSRGIVLPLRMLSASIPRLDEVDGAEVPGQERDDEIGDLARALSDGRARWREERRAREEAERLASLGRMAAGLAHEINNPVTAIRMHAQLMEGEGIADSVKIIVSETSRIESLVNQWMFLVRPESGATSRCEMAELVDETVRTMEPLMQHARVRVQCAVGAGGVLGDRRRIRQALDNVVLNAIHAMVGGGVLTVEGEVEGEGFELRIRDTGRGFSERALEHATDLFFSEKEGGMGIGLNVVREILRATGGALRLANAEVGALVTLRFPLYRP